MRIQGALLLATRKAHVLVPQVDLRSYAGCSEMDGQTLVLGVVGPQLQSKNLQEFAQLMTMRGNIKTMVILQSKALQMLIAGGPRGAQL